MTMFTSARGQRERIGHMQIDGMNVGAVFNGGGASEFGYDTAAASEVVVTAWRRNGRGRSRRPEHDLLPESGGNTFSGTVFGNTAGSWSQGSRQDNM